MDQEHYFDAAGRDLPPDFNKAVRSFLDRFAAKHSLPCRLQPGAPRLSPIPNTRNGWVVIAAGLDIGSLEGGDGVVSTAELLREG